MNSTEIWIREAQAHLRAIGKRGKERHVEALRQHVEGLDVDRALCDLGCGDDCEACSWGTLGGYPLREDCRLKSLLGTLEKLGADRTRPAPELTSTLQDLLDSLPKSR